MKELKLEVGKYYRTRNNIKAYVIGLFPEQKLGKTLIIGLNGNRISMYFPNGNIHNDKSKSEYDIISEWEDSPEEICKKIGFDASCISPWMPWITMDKNGKWHNYELEPVRFEFYWNEVSAGLIKIPTEHAPKNFQGNWTESKFKIK